MSGKVFSLIGSHGNSPRQQEDYYATDPIAVDKLLAKVDLPHRVWECACGEGHMVNRLKERGHSVYYSDKTDRGIGKQMDFLSADRDFYRSIEVEGIVTNPPFKHALEFVNKSLEIVNEGDIVCMFLRTLFLEGRKRYEELFSEHPPMLVLQMIDRVLCAKNGDFESQSKTLGKGAVAYAWFVWVKGVDEDTRIEWI